MARFKDFVPHGVIPAVLLPFHDDLSIDEPSFRSHLRNVEAVEGLSALTINAHSTEVASCTADEQSRSPRSSYPALPSVAARRARAHEAAKTSLTR